MFALLVCLGLEENPGPLQEQPMLLMTELLFSPDL